MKKKIANLIKNNPVILWIYHFFGSIFFHFIGLFIKSDANLILFSSMSGDLYGGSPRVLFEEIKRRYGTHFKYIWAFSNPLKQADCPALKVKIDTFRYFVTALRSGIWVTDVNIERGLAFKKKKTFYVNTWHGTGPKKGVIGRKDYNFSNVSLLVVDGDFAADNFQKYYHDKSRANMIFCGRPREDELFCDVEKKTEKFRNLFNVGDKKVILYVPTWRESDTKKDNSHFLPDIPLLEKNLGDRFVILYHGHHLAETVSNSLFNDFFRDCSSVSNLNDLFYASDILMTDYSSAFFDFLLLRRPIVIFASDYNQYLCERGLFFDLRKEVPGGVCETTTALIKRIDDIGADPQLQDFSAFLNKYVRRGPDATGKILDKMVKFGVIPPSDRSAPN